MAAAGGDGHDDMVAGLQLRHTAPDLADDAGALMPADHGKFAFAQPRHLRQVGMAQPRGADLDQNLALAGTFELDLLDAERLLSAYGVGRPCSYITAAVIRMACFLRWSRRAPALFDTRA